MSSGRRYILVEGHGEVEAAHNLVVRLDHRLGDHGPWLPPRRWKNLHQFTASKWGVLAGVEFIRSKPDVEGLLILRDEDDACPRDLAPGISERLRTLDLPFPVAYVLLHPEYEVLFLPCLSRMIQVGYPPTVRWDGATWESRRGIKEWLSKQLPPGRAYKPTADQLNMTRKLDFDLLEQADLPSFGSLQRAVRFLGERAGEAGAVYPAP
jgi:hypothetical protein